MKRINLIYLLAIPLCYLLFKMNSDLGKASAFFYGFAENKETELSHDKPVLIYKILVTPGQSVKKGELLMEVRQDAIDFKIDNANHDLAQLNIELQQRRQGVLDQIGQLKAKRTLKVAELETEIKKLEATILYNQSLLKDLQSINSENTKSSNGPNDIRLAAFKENLRLVAEPIDLEIAQLQKELSAIQTPTKILADKLKSEIDFYKSEQQKLAILAPTDGLIGNVLCKEGENISAFSKLINFYERNPTIVKGYIHESLILHVKEGDSLEVSSTLHPEQKIDGEVIGLGSRIVEIPERLRKIADFKTYGREVTIRIPATNQFLQKEKVMLNSVNWESDNSLTSMFNFFKKKNKKIEKNLEATIDPK